MCLLKGRGAHVAPKHEAELEHFSPSQTQFISVQSLSRVRLFVTPWTAACQASLSITNSQRLLNSCPLSQWCHPTISSSVIPFSSRLPSIFPSIRVFSNESALLFRWPKYWSFSFSISPPNEHQGLISFRMDQFDLLAVVPDSFWPIDYSLPSSSVWNSLARILEWIAIPFSRGFSQSRDQTWISHTGGKFFTIWATWEACNSKTLITKFHAFVSVFLCIWKLFI